MNDLPPPAAGVPAHAGLHERPGEQWAEGAEPAPDASARYDAPPRLTRTSGAASRPTGRAGDPAETLQLRGSPAAGRPSPLGGGVTGYALSPAEPAGPAARNAFLVYVAELESPRSRRAMSACLHRLAAMLHTAAGREPGAAPGERFPWAQLRAEHTAALRALVGARTVDGPDGGPVPWSPSYRNLHLSALRGVLRTAWRLGEMSTDDYQRAAAVRNFRGTRLPAGRSVHAAEFTALLAACAADPSPAGVRDAALLAVLYTTGARRAEVAALRREDYDPGERSLRITGKGDKQRIEYVHEGAAALLGAWLAADDRTSGPLFKPVHRSGAVQHRPMTDAAVRNAVVKRRKQAALPPVTPHDFRRTFIGDLLDQGVDLATVQHLVGHASPATTARYDRRPERRRRNAVDKLPFPPPAAPPP